MPPLITEEQFLEIKKVAHQKAQETAQEVAKRVYCQELKGGIIKAQQLALQQRAYQADIPPSGQQALFTSPDQGAQMNPHYLQQQAPQTVQFQHSQQTAHYPQQHHGEQPVNYTSCMPGNHTAPNNLQQQVTQVTPGQSPMQVNRAPSYNTPRVASTVPHYSLMQGNHAGLYPSPRVIQMASSSSPQRAGQVSSYNSPTQPSQVVGHQSLPTNQMAAFSIPQQAPQMGAYPAMQQTSQFVQQGHHVQPQAYYPQFQQPKQSGRYYTPIPAPQPNGYVTRYDPHNQAQIVAQQYRMQQGQMQGQQIQQSGMQYQPSLQDNLRNSAAMVAQANAANSRPQFRVEDFLP